MTGLRQALSVGIILMVISEMFAASNGIGFTVVQFQRTFAIPEMWTASSCSAWWEPCCRWPFRSLRTEFSAGTTVCTRLTGRSEVALAAEYTVLRRRCSGSEQGGTSTDGTEREGRGCHR
jgi:hypothetical protein